MDFTHISVLLEESVQNLDINKDGIYVDCTMGGGGHSELIVSKLSPQGRLVGIDRDTEALDASKKRLSSYNNVDYVHNNFHNIKQVLNELNIKEVDGVIADLGVSSYQLDNKQRGFSYMEDARLDMRMDKSKDLDAYKVVNTYSYEDLVNIFYKYGEEKYASSIAKGIINSRPITTTLELVEVIKNNVPEKYKRDKHPARKVFQAIRIEVNDELNVFEKSLKDALELIDVGGRICVITFHSLEDKICKNIFNSVSKVDDSLKHLPIIPDEYLPKFKVIKTIDPSKNELKVNTRARSAKLRIIERIGR